MIGRFRRRNGGGKVDKPFRIGRESAHHFERRRRVLGANRDAVMQARRDQTLAGNIVEFEHIVVFLLRIQSRDGIGDEKWPRRLGVGFFRGDGNDFPLRPAQSRQLASEHAAGVDVDRAIKPVGFGDRRMAVNNMRRPAIFRGPVLAHGKSEFIGFTGCFPIEGKFAHAARSAADILLLHARMSDDELAIVQNVMADQAIDEAFDFAEKCFRLGVQFAQRFGQAV